MFFKRTDNLSPTLTSYDFIKCATVMFMFIDHVGAFFLTDESWWRVFGRLGFPVWFFLAGYSRGREVSQTLWVGAALLISGNMVLGQYILPMNALVTYIAIRLTIAYIAKRAFSNVEMLIYGFVGLVFLSIPTNFMFEYGTLAFLLAMVGYAVRNKDDLGVGNITRIIFCGVAVLTVATLQSFLFGFDKIQSIVCIFEICVVGVLLMFFRPAEFPSVTKFLPGPVAAIIRFGGRYTLEIYVFHLLAIKIFLLATNYGFYKPFLPTIFPNFPEN